MGVHRERILIMAGGTGGHVFPGLAVAQELRDRGVEVVWLGTQRGLESRLVPAAGIQLEWIAVSGLRGKRLGSWLLAPLRLLTALVQSLVVIMRHRPTAVLGMGGFAAGPGGVMTWLLHKPLVIHEQNAIPGLTNRLLARLASRVLEAFPGSFPAKRHAVHTGNPVRADIAALESPERRLAGRDGPVRLLVLGGSQGARALNQAVPAALAQVRPRLALEVLHQAGAHHIDDARRAYQEAGVKAQVEPFLDGMAQAYAWADLVLCRAGALTIAELAAAGLGSVLVPFPFAVDDHQTHNAGYLVDAGAARLIPQADLTPGRLGEALIELCSRRSVLQEMACAARRLAKPDAAAQVAAHCLEVAHAA